MINMIMNQSSIRRFVANNAAREPKLIITTKTNPVQSTSTTKITTTVKPVVLSMPITNDCKIGTQKKEINPTELLRSMKYNVGKSPGRKLNFNTNINSNSNTNVNINTNVSMNKSQEENVNVIQSTPKNDNVLLQSTDCINKPNQVIVNNTPKKSNNGNEEIWNKEAVKKKEMEEMRKKNTSTPKNGINKQNYFKPTHSMAKPFEHKVIQRISESKGKPVIKKESSNSTISINNNSKSIIRTNSNTNLNKNYNNNNINSNTELKKRSDMPINSKPQRYTFKKEEETSKTNDSNLKKVSNLESEAINTEECKAKQTPSEVKPQIILPKEQKTQEPYPKSFNKLNTVNNVTNSIEENQLHSQSDQSTQLSLILQKEIEQLKKKNSLLEKENEVLFKEIDTAQKKCQESLHQIADLTSKSNKAINDLQQANILNSTLEQKIKTMEEDIELLNEELSTKDLELQVANKKYSDYKTVIESKEQTPSSMKMNQLQSIMDYSSMPQSEQCNKIIELEKIITDLSQSLTKSNQDREYTVNYYKSQIEDLNKKEQDNEQVMKGIPIKDDLIRQLTTKLKEYESIIDELKAQMITLSPANDLYEQVIIEKEEIELKYEELNIEYSKLKEDYNNDEELIREQEAMVKLSEKVEINNKNELIRAYDKIRQLENQLEEEEANQRLLKDRIGSMKLSNGNKAQINDSNKPIINNTVIINESIINSNNSNASSLLLKSKIDMFERQRVLLQIENIDNDDLKLRNQMIKTIIPKRVFDQASLESFERVLTLRTIRQKTFEVIFSIIKNNILSDSNLVIKSETTSLEIDSMKQIVNFYLFIVILLIEYSSAVFSIEISQSKSLNDIIPIEELKDLYMNILAGKQFLDIIIQLIKEDLLSIQSFQKIEGFKTIVNKLNEKLSKGKTNNNIVKYYKSLLLFIAHIIKAYKSGKNGLISKDNLTKGSSQSQSPLDLSLKSLVDCVSNIKKCLKMITYAFFDSALYEHIHSLLDPNAIPLTQINKLLQNQDYDLLTKDVYTNTWGTNFDTYLCLSNKICSIILTAIDKTTKTNKTQSINSDLAFLPQEEWNKQTKKMNSELTSFANVKEELQSANKKLKEERIENAQLKSQLEDLSRSKQYNDTLLTEMNTKASKVSQLESSIADYKKKLKTYVNVIDDLVRKDEQYQLDLNAYQVKCKEMTKELSAFKEGRRYIAPNLMSINGNDNLMNDNANSYYSNMLYSELLSKQKSLKERIMKEKMNQLINNEDSYINKCIETEVMNNKAKEPLVRVNREINMLNQDYNKLRISLPKVNDITIKSNREKEDRKKTMVNSTRYHYLQNASKILYNVLGNCMDDNAFKYFLHNDIEKRLIRYNDKDSRLLVGVIKLDSDTLLNNNDKTQYKAKPATNEVIGSIPILLNEDSLKCLNQTFIH